MGYCQHKCFRRHIFYFMSCYYAHTSLHRQGQKILYIYYSVNIQFVLAVDCSPQSFSVQPALIEHDKEGKAIFALKKCRNGNYKENYYGTLGYFPTITAQPNTKADRKQTMVVTPEMYSKRAIQVEQPLEYI